jgi:hypothetical protein
VVVGGSVLAVLIGMAVFAYVRIDDEHRRAVAAEKKARLSQAEEARQRQKVEKELRRAEKEKYSSIIREAEAKIAEGRIEEAEALLWSTPNYLRGWEWGRLMYACHQELLTLNPESGTVGKAHVCVSPRASDLESGIRNGDLGGLFAGWRAGGNGRGGWYRSSVRRRRWPEASDPGGTRTRGVFGRFFARRKAPRDCELG